MAQAQNLTSIDSALLEVAICASDLYLFSTSEGQTLFLNKAGKGMLGLTNKETPASLGLIFESQDGFIKDVMVGKAKAEGRSSHLLQIKRYGEEKFYPMRINCIGLENNIFLIIAKDINRELDLRSKNEELLRKLEDQSFALQENDRKYKEAQAAAKLGSWHFDIRSQSITWSDQMYDIFSLDKEKGEPNFEKRRSTIYHKDLPCWESTISHCVQSGLPFEMCFRVVCPDNRIVWVKSLGRGEFDKEGNVIAIYGTCQDITEQKRNQDLQEFVLGKLKIGIWQWNVPKDEVIWGRGMPSLYGLKASNMKTPLKAWEDFLSEDCRTQVVEEFKSGIQKEERLDFRFKINTSDGVRHIRSRCNVDKDAQGRPLYAYGINYDITNEILLNEKFEQERAKMIQASKLATLGEMAAGIAHEINNPLTIINGSASMINFDPQNSERVSESVTKIINSVERISRIITGLRKFSRQSDGLQRESCGAYSMLAEAKELTSSSANMRKVPLMIEEFEDFELECDEVQILQVLVNLITNALDVQDSVETAWVKMRAYLRGSSAIFEIRDAGKGIPSNVVQKLFNPFFTTKDVGHGTGLGLSISKGIAQDHGGDLEYSLKNGHTCFTLSLKRSVNDVKKTPAA